MDNQDERDKLVDLVCADGLFADAGHPAGRVLDPRLGGDNLDFWAHDADYNTLQAATAEVLVHFYLGQWLQTLRAAGLAASHHKLPLCAVIDCNADAMTGGMFADQLRAQDGDAGVVSDLERLDATLRTVPATGGARALLDAVGRIDEVVGP